MGTLGKKDLTARLRVKDNIDNSIPTIKTEAKNELVEQKVVFVEPKPIKKEKSILKDEKKEVYRTCFWVSDEIKNSLDIYSVQNSISIKDIITEIVGKIKKKEVSALSKKNMVFPEQKQVNAFLSKEDKSFLKVLGINTGMSFTEILTRGIVKYLEDNQ